MGKEKKREGQVRRRQSGSKARWSWKGEGGIKQDERAIMWKGRGKWGQDRLEKEGREREVSGERASCWEGKNKVRIR